MHDYLSPAAYQALFWQSFGTGRLGANGYGTKGVLCSDTVLLASEIARLIWLRPLKVSLPHL